MNEYIQDLASIDYLSLVTAVVIGMGLIVSLKELFIKFCNATGIELTVIREKREMKECQTIIKKQLKDLKKRQDDFEVNYDKNIKLRNEFNDKVMDCIEAIKIEISDMRKDTEIREAKKKFEHLRDDIVSFANELALRDAVSSELMENIFRKVEKYESLSQEYHFKNNQAPISIDAIKMKYQEMILKGQIIKKED